MRTVNAITLFVLAFLSPNPVAIAQTHPTAAAVVAVSGHIDDYERDALMRRFETARVAGAKTVIVEIDTYGGLVTSALDISRFIKRQTDLHTIAFVRDKAISAGAMIAFACDEIVMQPSSVIGDCAPISYRMDGTLESLPPAERAKAESPVLADFRDSAVRNHQDPLLAEAMVIVGREIRFAQSPSGEKKIVTGEEFKSLTDAGWTSVANVVDPINRSDKLLTLYSRDATAIGMSKGEFATPTALATARGLNIIAHYEPGVGEQFIEVLASPITRLILIVIFVVSLKIALSAPGHGLPEAIALISIGLLLGIPLLTGYATWWEVAMIFVGLALVAFEIFVFPGHFVSAIIGLVLIVGGLVLTFAGGEPSHPGVMPTMSGTWSALQRGLLIVTLGLVCSLALWVWLSRYLPKIPYFGKLMLQSPGGDARMIGAIGADVVWPLVGATGKTVTDLKPGGTAEFVDSMVNNTRHVSVVTDGAFVRAGTNVVVIESRGNRVVVRPAES